MEAGTLTYVRHSASYAPAIKLNATATRAADILANLVIKYDVTKDLSFGLLRRRKGTACSWEVFTGCRIFSFLEVPSLLFKAPLLVQFMSFIKHRRGSQSS